MNQNYVAFSVIATAFLVGISIPVVQQQGVPEFNRSLEKINLSELEPGQDTNGEAREGLVYGTAHKHALFHVIINGSEKDFTDRKFQLNSKYVHLENNRSNIVHNHAEGVTWKKFLETINTSVNQNQSYVCIEIYGNRSCGEGSIVLNGERDPDLGREIGQGDNLLVILETANATEVVEEYMKKQLPRLYKSSENRGHRI